MYLCKNTPLPLPGTMGKVTLMDVGLLYSLVKKQPGFTIGKMHIINAFLYSFFP